MAITNVAELEAYFKTSKARTNRFNNAVTLEKIQELAGGTGNFVWRIQTPSGITIVKHAEPYVKAIPSMPFPVDRMDVEARVLQTLPNILPCNGHVVLPKVLNYDSQNYVLILTDGGEKTLKEAYLNSDVDVKLLGERAGKWLSNLHQATRSFDIGAGGNPTGCTIYRYIYDNLHSQLPAYGVDPTLGHYVNEHFGSLLATDDLCVCHGDFWPGNLLLNSSTDNEVITVVDWEMCRRGHPATDVAQFAAEAYLLERFYGNRGMLSAFLKAYVGGRELGEDFLQRFLVHWGTHVTFWGTITGWTSEYMQLKALVEVGTEVIQMSVQKKWEALRNSDIRDILREMSVL